MTAAQHAGLAISRGEAIKWITANPARAMGISDYVGTLEPGKNADVVLWSANPFSVYARADRVWIDGVPMWDRARSEEHTSELQSLMRISYAVFCLKKKKQLVSERRILKLSNIVNNSQYIY